MTPDTPVDLDALARAAASDRAALERLLAAVRPRVLRLCARFLPDARDAEEACQDTLLAVAHGIGEFKGDAAFTTWLYRVAANRSRSTYRALRRRHVEAELPPEIVDHRRTSVLAGHRIALLEGLDRVGPLYAEVIALRDVLGMPYREIGELLGLTEVTARTRAHEGRRRLREVLV